MFRLVLLLLGITPTVINAVKFSDLPTTVNITLGEDAIFTVSVSDLNGEELSWVVGETKVANLTSGSEGLMLNGGKTLDDSLYDVTTINNDTTLTLKTPRMTFNGTKVKLTDGAVESNTSTLLIMVVCVALENGASASCFDVGCTASGDTSNDTSTAGKYRKCVDSYSCESDGSWSETHKSCTELICDDSGKWGENCTMDCADGCPMKMCFANGSCADALYMNITACNEGYAGDKCDQQVTLITATSSGQAETSQSQAQTSSSSISSTSASSSATSTSSSATSASSSATSTSITIPTESSSTAPSPGSCNDTELQPSVACSTPGKNMTTVRTCERISGKIETCTKVWTCDDDRLWKNQTRQCTFNCKGGRTWGPECRYACGEGCRVNLTVECDAATGRCLDPVTGSLKTEGPCATAGYEGVNCDQPKCEDCNGGVCLAPNFCGNCPRHFEHGRTCRNIRLDGFLKGSLPSLAILAGIVIVLTLLSKWYIRNKIKEA